MTPESSNATWWRPWFAPIVVALALIVDYGSPAAIWTAALPLVFMALLLVQRERAAAVAVLVLSSWIGIPLAAGVVRGVDAVRGVHRAYLVHLTAQALDPGVEVSCTGDTHLSIIEIDGRRPLADLEAQVAGTFAAAYNAMSATAIERDCRPQPTASEAQPELPKKGESRIVIGGGVNVPDVPDDGTSGGHGAVEEIQIYDRALSADEIRALTDQARQPK